MTATPPPAYLYTPDTPTSTAASLRANPARASLPQSSAPDADGHRQSRFMEEGLAPMRQSPAPSSVPSTPANTTPARPTSIDPASIPTRTSSSRAFSNGEPQSQHPHDSPSSPRGAKNLMMFPEEGKHRMSAGVGGQGEQSSSMDNAPPVGQDLIHGDGSRWTPEKENIVKGPFDYLESHPGKDVRTQLIDAFNLWLQVSPASLAIINKVVGMLHTASLLIDDVEDNSNLRRGVPVAHSIFGTAQTINSANYIYFCALQELSLLPDPPAAIRIYTDELLNLHRGQGMDLFWRDTLTCPSEDDYLEMVGNKTGGLFRLAIKLMHACSPTAHLPIDYVPLVNTIGLLFQILDDYRNLSSPTYTSNKGLCEDLTEGKFSFPIIHAIRAAPSNLVLINILKQKPSDDEVKKYAVGYMERVGSFTYTRRVLRGLTRKALGLVDEVDGGRGEGGGVRGILEMLRVEKEGKREVKAGGVA